MKKLSIGRRAAVLLAVLAAFASASAPAAELGSKPLRIVVPFAAGGTADVLARVLAEKMRSRFPRGVLVENRTGAGGNVGAESVFRSEADGHTVLLSSPGPISVNQSLYPKLTFEPDKWIAATVIAEVPNALVTGPKLPVKTAGDFIAYVKAHPGQVSYASQGNGTTSHLTAKLFETAAGVEMIHVPYRGDTPAMADLSAGQVDAFFTNLSATMALHKAGKVQILAVADAKRAGTLPQVPTFAELGLPQMRAVTWYAVVAPPGTPADTVKALNEALVAAIAEPDVRRRMTDLGLTPVGSTPAQAASFVRGETLRWQKVIRTAKVAVE
jgi:tripartite-type tricarboxylate transporter receptor subunit TctC